MIYLGVKDKMFNCNILGKKLNIPHTITAMAIKNSETKEFAINDITGITSTGNTTFFTK